MQAVVDVKFSRTQQSKDAHLALKWDLNSSHPAYATSGSAGFDISADFSVQVLKEQNNYAARGIKVEIPPNSGSVCLLPGQRKLIPTGFIFDIPPGYEIQLRPRSGLALKNGITLANCIGTVDSDYKLEVGVILVNHGDQDFTVTHGMRIAQAVLCPVTRANLRHVNETIESAGERKGGFGSTGL